MQDVANAVGAALGTVGGASDIIVNLGPIKEMLKKQLQGSSEDGDAGGGDGGECDETKLEECARELALEKGRESARNEVITKKGLCVSVGSVRVHVRRRVTSEGRGRVTHAVVIILVD